ncbi:MAG: hypothetical protein K2X39_00715, partial [Silvanigrellaceae bacterium]|nr:hypothetical protein [Silvanigrellaceae bacterium]
YGFVKNVDLEKIKLCTKIVRFIKQNSLMNTLENKSEIYEHLQQANFSAALEQASLLIKDSTVSDNSKINLVATLANLDANTSEQITQQIVKIKKDIPALCEIDQSMILKAILEIPSEKLEECLECIVKRFSDLDNSKLKTLFIVPLYEIEELDKFVQDLNLDQPYLAIHSLHYLSKEDQQKALNLFKSLALGIDDKIKRDIIFKIVSSVPNLINGDLTQLNESFKSICTEETTMEDLSYLWMFIAILPEGDRKLLLDDPEGFRDSSKNYLTKLIEDGLAADKHRSEWMFMGNQFKKPEFFKKLLKCFYFHVLDSKSPYFDLDGDSPINQFDVILAFLKECNTEASLSIASRLSNYVYNSKTSSLFKLFLNGTSSELIIRGTSTTHAFLYHIVKDQSGKTHFKVYDSAGNFSRYEGTGVVVFENIEPKLINEKFLYELLEFKHSTGEVVNWINKYFESYSPLHKPFKPQKHGSCSYKCFSKFLHAEMGDLEYLKFKVFLTEKHISIVESMLAKLAPISKKEFEKMKKEGQEVLVKRKRKLSDLQGQSNNSVLVR